jgi:hypothetical protein
VLKLSWNRRGGKRISCEINNEKGELDGTFFDVPNPFSKYRKKHPFTVKVPLFKLGPKRPKQFFKELIFVAFDKGWLDWFSLNKIGFEYWAKDMKYKRERGKK